MKINQASINILKKILKYLQFIEVLYPSKKGNITGYFFFFVKNFSSQRCVKKLHPQSNNFKN